MLTNPHVRHFMTSPGAAVQLLPEHTDTQQRRFYSDTFEIRLWE